MSEGLVHTTTVSATPVKKQIDPDINSVHVAYQADPARIALEEMKSYCAAHPGSPSATRRPALSIRSGVWIALLGPSWEEGIIGIGYTVELALRAFDRQYMAGQHSPSEPDENRAARMRAHRLIRSTQRLSLRGRTS